MNKDDESSSYMWTILTDIAGAVFDLMWKHILDRIDFALLSSFFEK